MEREPYYLTVIKDIKIFKILDNKDVNGFSMTFQRYKQLVYNSQGVYYLPF